MEIKAVFDGGLKVKAKFDEFEVPSDHAVKNGGDNSAPDPFSIFLSSIINCAGFFVLKFCQSREIPTDGISLNLVNDFNPKERRAENIKITVNVPESFPKKYEKALIKAVDQCSVKKTILAQPNFEVTTQVV